MAGAADHDDHPVGDALRGVDARIGQVVAGSYRITRHLGSGGSSHVFAVEHVRLGRAFALKLLRTELDPSKGAAQRFRREARAVARLQSEHVVSVIDCGELEDQTPYLVMELLQGEDLRSLLQREGSLPVRRAVRLMLEACRGLSAVHAAGFVHRDIKPENLFITQRSGGEDWCKVLDFGVAKMEASASTVQGAIVGTVRYMAPEQLTDSASVGSAADFYALGAILYECLAGRHAHTGTTIQEVMFSVMNKRPAPLDELRPGLPRLLLETIDICLDKAPDKRPQSAEWLAQRLERIFVEPGQSPDHTLAEDVEAPARITQAPTRDAAAVTRDAAPVAAGARAFARPGLLVATALAAALGGGAIAWFSRSAVAPAAEPELTAAKREESAALPIAAPPAPKPEPPKPEPPKAEPASVATPQTAAPTAPSVATPPAPPSPSHVVTTARPLGHLKGTPTKSNAQPASGASAPHVKVGNLDQANPYGDH